MIALAWCTYVYAYKLGKPASHDKPWNQERMRSALSKPF